MNINEMINHVDHTLLKAYAKKEDIFALCDEAIELKTASVCIPPSFIAPVKEKYGDKLTICTVIGFPLGYCTKETKVFETQDAVLKGADEIDMVINVGLVKDKEYELVLDEIKAVREACEGKILKVIIETCYLDEEEKIKLCQLVTEAKADYIKTSTGFGTAGATIQDIKLFKANIGPEVKMKAAGGIRTYEAFKSFIDEGCDRVGASATREFIKSAN